MPTKIVVARTGGPDVLKLEQTQRSILAPDEVWIEHEAIGVNYRDVMQRNGAVQIQTPSGLGLEGAGRVIEIGTAVSSVSIGDRVAYAQGPLGSYASGRNYPSERLIKLPNSISFDTAAAITFKGITAQYLLKSTYPVQQGTIVLLYGVAGALGQIMVPWAKHLGASVIGVVSKPESIEIAKERGCDEVLVWGQGDLASQVNTITNGRKVDVVYDGIGKLTFMASLNSLRPKGLMVSIGASSGAPDPVPVNTLNSKGSLFLTRPSIAAYATEITEYKERVDDVYSAVSKGIFSPQIWKSFTLNQVAQAHIALETGKSTGPVILKP